MNHTELQQIFQIMLTAASKASQLQKEYFRKTLKVEEKSSHTDLVTEVDFKSQKIIIESIQNDLEENNFNLDDFGFIGEEGVNKTGKYNFIVDPLDGTVNYAIGTEFFSILIAFEIAGEEQIGLIYRSFFDDYYFAIKNQGTFKVSTDGQKQQLQIQPTEKKDIILNLKTSSARFIKKEFIDEIRGTRYISGIGVETGYLVENIFNLIFFISHRGPRIWDLAATKIIIEEAGGTFFDRNGQKLILDYADYDKKYNCIGGHPENLNKIYPNLIFE